MAAPRPKKTSAKTARENAVVQDFAQHKHELDKTEAPEQTGGADQLPPGMSGRPVPNLTQAPVTDQAVAAAHIFGEDDGTGWEEGWTEIWKPMAGDVLMGVLMDVQPFEKGPYDFPCNRYELVDQHGELYSFVPGQVFDQVVEDKGISIGCKLHITYKGKRASSGNSDNTMNAWGIKFKRPAQ